MKNQKKIELDALKDIVESAFGADIMTPNRDRVNVNARRSFSNILIGIDFSLSEIGRYLGKDHATIIHYRNTFDGIMISDKPFKKIHTDSAEAFLRCSALMEQVDDCPTSDSSLHFWTDLQKVDELLRIDASMYCNLGTDSSDSERSEVKKNSQSIYRAIKKIDPASGGIFMYDIDKV